MLRVVVDRSGWTVATMPMATSAPMGNRLSTGTISRHISPLGTSTQRTHAQDTWASSDARRRHSRMVVRIYLCVNHVKSQIVHVLINEEPTELICWVASTTNDLSSGYTMCVHYIQHLLANIVDVPYINNNWSLNEFKVELKKRNKQCVRA